MAELKGKCRVILDHGYNLDLDDRGGYWGSKPNQGAVSEPVKTLAEAKQKVRAYIRENDLGGGNWTGGNVLCNGKLVARISYNGRAWSPEGESLGRLEKSDCHWRINTAETDFAGGKTRAEALKRQKEIYKARGVKGRLYKTCSKPGAKAPKRIPALLQWGMLAAAGVGLYFALR